MNTITANDLKTRGIRAFCNEPTIVSYRGKPRYLVLPESQFEVYELFLLDNALKKAREEIESGRYIADLDEHFKEIDDV